MASRMRSKNACNGLSGQILQRVLETEFKVAADSPKYSRKDIMDILDAKTEQLEKKY